jgi:hypothetical protein
MKDDFEVLHESVRKHNKLQLPFSIFFHRTRQCAEIISFQNNKTLKPSHKSKLDFSCSKSVEPHTSNDTQQ